MRFEENSLKELNNLIDNIPVGLCSYFYDGKTIFPIKRNQKFYEILGYNNSVSNKKDSLFRIHPDDIKKTRELLKISLKSGGYANSVIRLFNPEKNKYIYLQIDCTIIKGKNNTANIYSQYTDISNLITYQKDSSKLDDIIPLAIFKVLLDEDLTLLYYNSTFLKIFNVERNYVVEECGNKLLNLISSRNRKKIKDLTLSLKKGEPFILKQDFTVNNSVWNIDCKSILTTDFYGNDICYNIVKKL